MKSKKLSALVWLRDDFRLMDNPALSAALRAHGNSVLLYLSLPEEISTNSGKLSAAGLGIFMDILRERNIPFAVDKGDLDDLNHLVSEYGITHIYWNRRYAPELRTRDEQIKKYFREKGIQPESFPGNLLAEPWEYKTKERKFYRDFTPYYKNFISAYSPPETSNPEKFISGFSPEDFFIHPGSLEKYQKMKNQLPPGVFSLAGEESGKRALENFIRTSLADYPLQRDFPARKGTSGISAYLARGFLGIHYVWNKILAAETPENSEGVHAFLRQLVWRDFSWHVYYHFPKLDKNPYQKMYENFPWSKNQGHWKAWESGDTGYTFVDAGMRQLLSTGFIHNRPRMIAASFLTKHLRIAWTLGMETFARLLYDHDVAINAFSWQWVAGCGMDAAPYFRIFNPVTQAKKFDPQGEYASSFIPDNGDLFGGRGNIHEPIIRLDEEREKTLSIYYLLRKGEH